MSLCSAMSQFRDALPASLTEFERGNAERDIKYGYTWAATNPELIGGRGKKIPLFTWAEGIHITGPLLTEMATNARTRHRNTQKRIEALGPSDNRRNFCIAVVNEGGRAPRQYSFKSNHPVGNRIAEEFDGQWLDFGPSGGESAVLCDSRGVGLHEDEGQGGNRQEPVQTTTDSSLHDTGASAIGDARKRIQGAISRRNELRSQTKGMDGLAHSRDGRRSQVDFTTSRAVDIEGDL